MDSVTATQAILDDSPAIWAGSLHAYNCGRLHGRWIKLDGLDAEELRADIEQIVITGGNPGGDWAIMDYDGFGELSSMLGENPGLDNLLALAELINEHGLELVEAAADCCSDSDAETLARVIDEQYIGEFDSLAGLSEYLLDETGELNQIPGNLRNYFDHAAYGRDLELGGDVTTTRKGGTLYCIWNS